MIGHRVGARKQAREETIVEARNAKHDGDVIEPGKIAAEDQRDLKYDGDSPAQ